MSRGHEIDLIGCCQVRTFRHSTREAPPSASELLARSLARPAARWKSKAMCAQAYEQRRRSRSAPSDDSRPLPRAGRDKLAPLRAESCQGPRAEARGASPESKSESGSASEAAATVGAPLGGDDSIERSATNTIDEAFSAPCSEAYGQEEASERAGGHER